MQDSEPIRDQCMTDSINSNSNSRTCENDKSGTTILENMGEQGIIDEAIIDREDKIIETRLLLNILKIVAGMIHLLIFLLHRGKVQGPAQSTPYVIMCHENLPPQFRAFAASLDSTTIPKNIHTVLECPE